MDLETLERRTQSLTAEAHAARSRLFGLLKNVAMMSSPSGAVAAARALGFDNRIIAILSDVWLIWLLLVAIWLMTPFLWASADAQRELDSHRDWSRSLGENIDRRHADQLLSGALGQVTLTAFNENLVFWFVAACIVGYLAWHALSCLAI